jgi:hypothetical protein
MPPFDGLAGLAGRGPADEAYLKALAGRRALATSRSPWAEQHDGQPGRRET